jgi:uncharacterized Fe-S center protein
LGSLLKLVSKFNPFLKPVRKADTCVCPADHKPCTKGCPQSIGPQERGSAECTKCLECYIRCKNKNVKINWFETPDAVLSVKRFFKTKPKKATKET